MHFALTEEQRMIQQLAREFASQEIAPLSAQHDREQSFPLQVHAKALELGLLNIALPAEFGGAGLGALEVALVTEQLCRACLGIGTALCVNALAAEPILLAGTPEQKQAWLPRFAAGQFASFALTEPGAGSDAAGIRSTATRDGSDANNCRLYVDGEEVDLTTRNGNWAAGFSFRIGTMGTGSGQFKGLLDEIAIWDRVLSADEVAAIYNAAIGTPPEGTRPGDANCDGVVDQLDAQVLAENWLTTGAFWLAGDFNNDQVVNDIDATILAANWGYGASQSASAPEPSAIAMLLVMAAGFAAYGRRYL